MTPHTMNGGKLNIPTIGSRAAVMHGNAKMTTGNLKKKDLMMKKGRIVSVKASKSAKKNKNLGRFQQRKGSKKFGPKKAKTQKKRKSKRKGGMHEGVPHEEEPHEEEHEEKPHEGEHHKEEMGGKK